MFRVLLIGWLLALVPHYAWAHAVLVATSPADGQQLANAPAAVILTFNEPVTPVSVRLLDAGGSTVAGLEGAVAEADEVRLPLAESLPHGRYVLSYRVTSIDAHPVGGSIAFGVGVPAASASSAPQMGPINGWWASVALLHLVATAALLTAAGLSLFTAFVAESPRDGLRSRLARRRRQAVAIGVPAAMIGVGVQGGYLGDLPPLAMATLEPWRLGFASTAGRSAVLAMLGAGLLLARTTPLRVLIATALITGSFAATGHAAAAPPRGLATAAVMLHAAGIAFWLGSLIALEATLGFGPLRRITATVRRFSRLAIPIVAALLTAGLALAALQIRDPAAILANDYTMLLGLKLVLVAVLLALALYNNRFVTPRLARGDGTAAATLRGSVRAEIGCVALILLVTVILGRTPPPRALDPAVDARPPLGIVTQRQGRLAFIELAPVNHAYAVSVSLLEPSGQPLVADEVTLRLANPAGGIEPMERKLTRQAAGTYAADTAVSLLPGRWALRIDARTGDFDLLIFETEASIR